MGSRFTAPVRRSTVVTPPPSTVPVKPVRQPALPKRQILVVITISRCLAASCTAAPGQCANIDPQ
jgi:hypothetical protein